MKLVTFCSISFLLYSSQAFPGTKNSRAPSTSVSLPEELTVPSPFGDVCALRGRRGGQGSCFPSSTRENLLTGHLKRGSMHQALLRAWGADLCHGGSSPGVQQERCTAQAAPPALLPTLLHMLPLAFPQLLPPQHAGKPEEHPAKHSSPCQSTPRTPSPAASPRTPTHPRWG